MKYTEGQYVIAGLAVQYWIPTNATTLRGAKMIASRTYQAVPGGKIEVAVVTGIAQQRFETVAIKRGFDAWTDAF